MKIMTKEQFQELYIEIAEVKKQNLSDFSGNSAEGHAYAVNNKISNSEIRNLHILFAV